jgi:hypothetical protein
MEDKTNDQVFKILYLVIPRCNYDYQYKATVASCLVKAFVRGGRAIYA